MVVKCRFFKEIQDLSNIKFTYTLKSLSIQNLCVIQNIIVITMIFTMRNIYIEETSFFQREKRFKLELVLAPIRQKGENPGLKESLAGGQ